jgi:exonuclease 1
MGIQNLLPQLKQLLANRHISYFRGKSVAVDGYAWLHRAAYGCCVDLTTGVENESWIQYCIGYLRMLEAFNITTYLVFDGDELPAKRGTELERAENRRLSLQRALSLSSAGDSAAARAQFVRSVDITPKMAARLIQVLKVQMPAVRVVVAPYEADAQLAHLVRSNIVDAVISEDSDTIPFACNEVIFKLDKQGNCQHLVLGDLFTKPNLGFDLTGFDQDMVILLCITAGCDYLVKLVAVLC